MIDNETQISLQTIYDKLTELHAQLNSQSETAPRVYDNKALMSHLGIKDRYLKRLRDNGLLGYSRNGDKYWYTQADVDHFLACCHFAPFAYKTGGNCVKSACSLLNVGFFSYLCQTTLSR